MKHLLAKSSGVWSRFLLMKKFTWLLMPLPLPWSRLSYWLVLRMPTNTAWKTRMLTSKAQNIQNLPQKGFVDGRFSLLHISSTFRKSFDLVFFKSRYPRPSQLFLGFPSETLKKKIKGFVHHSCNKIHRYPPSPRALPPREGLWLGSGERQGRQHLQHLANLVLWVFIVYVQR